MLRLVFRVPSVATRLICVALLAIPALGWAEPAPNVIRIAVPDVSAGAQPSGGPIIDILHQRRLLEDAFAADHIEIKWLYFKGAGPAINEALANHQVDFAFLGDLAAIIGRASGLDTRLLSAVSRQGNLYLATRRGLHIKQLADLKGRKVAIFRGTADQLSFDAALAAAGLSESDLKIINLDVSSAAAALSAGAVDAAWIGLSAYVLQHKGVAEVPLSTKTLPNHPGTILSVLVGSGNFVEHYPRLTQRVLDVTVGNALWASQAANQQQLLATAAQQASIPLPLLQQEVAGEDPAELYAPGLDAAFLDRLQQGANLAQQQHLIRKPVQVRQWQSPHFVETALANHQLRLLGAPAVAAPRVAH